MVGTARRCRRVEIPAGKQRQRYDLRYRLPKVTAEVLANESSKECEISMIQFVPSLVSCTKTMLPLSFATGVGRPYDEPDVANAIDWQKGRHFRHIVLPQVVPQAVDFKVWKLLETGAKVADFGCGAGILLLTMARAFHNCTLHGFEMSMLPKQKSRMSF